MIPTPRSSPSPPARTATGAGGQPTRQETCPNQVQAPGPPQARCQEPQGQSCPQHQAALSASPTAIGYAAATLEAAELLLRAGKSDPAAWEEILRRYRGVVTAKIRTFRLQDADALDAAQTTWLRLAENLHRIQHPERLGGWLAITAARECLHILHQAKRTPTVTDVVVANVADPAASPEQHVIDAETAQTLRMLVAELPPRRRRLLRALFTDHPQSYAEISRTTGIPPGSIGPTRNRALHQLRQMLQDHQHAPPTQR
ncbi:MAG: RNA polymerase sigma factor [Pseudonocardiaceae bacterium]